jgi:hypothetical protein
MRQAASTIVMAIAALSIGAAPPPDAYVDAWEAFAPSAEKERWFTMEGEIKAAFADLCGDTFCEGEFSNIEPISFRCSAARSSGELKSCVWVFGESEESIDPQTGAIQVNRRIVVCDIPVTGTAAALVDALLVPGASSSLDRKLPGTNASLNEALQKCL